jgi:hypothetical protein
MEDVGIHITRSLGIPILRLFGVVCGHLAYFMVISHFDMLYQEKSGNPVYMSFCSRI